MSAAAISSANRLDRDFAAQHAVNPRGVGQHDRQEDEHHPEPVELHYVMVTSYLRKRSAF